MFLKDSNIFLNAQTMYSMRKERRWQLEKDKLIAYKYFISVYIKTFLTSFIYKSSIKTEYKYCLLEMFWFQQYFDP